MTVDLTRVVTMGNGTVVSVGRERKIERLHLIINITFFIIYLSSAWGRGI